ncbi:hypothetical protein K7432_017272 [Basidiobolus ranarum]|uniref:Uncharacterized protein n=1 Tax=Basidiobolus ranarum TaxID=34480 RepID=A0ABR2VKK4_9FUNG
MLYSQQPSSSGGKGYSGDPSQRGDQKNYPRSRYGRQYEEDNQDNEYEGGLTGRSGQKNYPHFRYGCQYEEDEQDNEYYHLCHAALSVRVQN